MKTSHKLFKHKHALTHTYTRNVAVVEEMSSPRICIAQLPEEEYLKVKRGQSGALMFLARTTRALFVVT